MISNFKFQKGVTLVEIIVVVFIVALFSSIAIFDFPKIQGNSALSGAAYELAQNIRNAQNWALSGVANAGGSTNATGYGVYLDSSDSNHYIVYANTCPSAVPDNLYNYGCDYVIKSVDISANDPGVYIQAINNISGTNTSINFIPPNPKINIQNIIGDEIEIVLSLDADHSQKKTVTVNKSGLIDVK